ncbi:MAG TPA: TetR/AcrR family transcriptional regulator [Phenylobacterium sp.]|uniref:TetR/AcrR family transcriptional regulator n=1 Tax=Phenylobacterium sp. TaxID=1871053 RepID=UPI002D6750BD|nr:TetR/AcrR family transcriptional regulator [Phenylobacterium sp.]HZZ68713.1 TetR/AcrR family transcriptional regulator [Phenylobacterium sp.]
MTSIELGPRATPQQARSRATMQRILKVSAELLEEVGIDGFNTNLLAERAGLGTRAIYRYFPNKFAILVAMAQDLRATERAWIGNLREPASSGDWRDAVARAIDGHFEAASRHPGYAALRAAAFAIPELRESDSLDNRALAQDLAAGLTTLGVVLDPGRMGALCRTIMESSNRMLDIALQSPRDEAIQLVRELKLMITSLLENYVPHP